MTVSGKLFPSSINISYPPNLINPSRNQGTESNPYLTTRYKNHTKSQSLWLDPLDSRNQKSFSSRGSKAEYIACQRNWLMQRLTNHGISHCDFGTVIQIIDQREKLATLACPHCHNAGALHHSPLKASMAAASGTQFDFPAENVPSCHA